MQSGSNQGVDAAARKPISVSVLLVTYNHERHIRRALDGLLMQDVRFPIEIVIADDGSSDATRDLIVERLGDRAAVGERLPFRFLDYSRNRGITRNYQRGFYACHSQYISVLEGDDYWTDPHKLQTQVDFLERHWECIGCSHNYLVHEEQKANFYPRTMVAEGWRYISARQLIADNLIGNFSTCVYRAEALRALPPRLFEETSYDWIMNIALMRKGMFGFFNMPMSVYRLHASGAWSGQAHAARLAGQEAVIETYDSLTGHVFTDAFSNLRHRLQAEIAAMTRPVHDAGLIDVPMEGWRSPAAALVESPPTEEALPEPSSRAISAEVEVAALSVERQARLERRLATLLPKRIQRLLHRLLFKAPDSQAAA